MESNLFHVLILSPLSRVCIHVLISLDKTVVMYLILLEFFLLHLKITAAPTEDARTNSEVGTEIVIMMFMSYKFLVSCSTWSVRKNKFVK